MFVWMTKRRESDCKDSLNGQPKWRFNYCLLYSTVSTKASIHKWIGKFWNSTPALGVHMQPLSKGGYIHMNNYWLGGRERNFPHKCGASLRSLATPSDACRKTGGPGIRSHVVLRHDDRRLAVKWSLWKASLWRPCAYFTSLFSYSLSSKTIVLLSLGSFEALPQADRDPPITVPNSNWLYSNTVGTGFKRTL